MKLSEAIRLGAMLGPQERGGWMDGAGRCALAGAADVCGLPAAIDSVFHRPMVPYRALEQRFPILARKGVLWPPAYRSLQSAEFDLMAQIYYLNDIGRWTREDIANWVATVEAAEQSWDARAQHEPADAGVAEVRA